MPPSLRPIAATALACAMLWTLGGCASAVPYLKAEELPVVMEDELVFMPAGAVLLVPAWSNLPPRALTNRTPGVYYSARAHELMLHRRITNYQPPGATP
jgi:hypothetical protein